MATRKKRNRHGADYASPRIRKGSAAARVFGELTAAEKHFVAIIALIGAERAVELSLLERSRVQVALQKLEDA
jgi:hypothetical protein